MNDEHTLTTDANDSSRLARSLQTIRKHLCQWSIDRQCPFMRSSMFHAVKAFPRRVWVDISFDSIAWMASLLLTLPPVTMAVSFLPPRVGRMTVATVTSSDTSNGPTPTSHLRYRSKQLKFHTHTSVFFPSVLYLIQRAHGIHGVEQGVRPFHNGDVAAITAPIVRR